MASSNGIQQTENGAKGNFTGHVAVNQASHRGWPRRRTTDPRADLHTNGPHRFPRKSETRFRPVVSTDLPLIVGRTRTGEGEGEGWPRRGADRSRVAKRCASWPERVCVGRVEARVGSRSNIKSYLAPLYPEVVLSLTPSLFPFHSIETTSSRLSLSRRV